MAYKTSTIDSLTSLFDGSSRPIYAIDAERRIVYCNRALATWLDMKSSRIVGRVVEYHSEPAIDDEESRDEAPLTELCPPPRAFAGEQCIGTLSCQQPGGRLVHRPAEFMPLTNAAAEKPSRAKDGPALQAVLVVLATADLSTQDLATNVSGEAKADDLHRTIRRFRWAQASRYSIESLLGGSLAMQKVRAQLAAATASGANTLICGRRGSGRGHAARAIHYFTATDIGAKLLPIDSELMTDDLLRRILERFRASANDKTQRPTLLLENLERMATAHQKLLYSAIHEKLLGARIIATCSSSAPHSSAATGEASNVDSGEHDEVSDDSPVSPAAIDRELFNAVSTITIEMPSLVDRMEDLPVIAQYFLESCNHGSTRQIGSFRSDALDLMALYSWPGELDQLRQAIAAAHRAATSHEITATDLPPIVHHAEEAARRGRREPERIVLDDVLAAIEKESILRALAQANGNKSEAAILLGMTRPRLYRRLVQLGLVSEGDDEPQSEQPKFIEQEPTE